VRTIALADHTRRLSANYSRSRRDRRSINLQVERDFAPAWEVTSARFTVGGRGDKIHFFDSAHLAGDYGWHTVDAYGLPYAHVFADPSISDWISAHVARYRLPVSNAANRGAYHVDRLLPPPLVRT
jgi:hypothetical protein